MGPGPAPAVRHGHRQGEFFALKRFARPLARIPWLSGLWFTVVFVALVTFIGFFVFFFQQDKLTATIIVPAPVGTHT